MNFLSGCIPEDFFAPKPLYLPIGVFRKPPFRHPLGLLFDFPDTPQAGNADQGKENGKKTLHKKSGGKQQ